MRREYLGYPWQRIRISIFMYYKNRIVTPFRALGKESLIKIIELFVCLDFSCTSIARIIRTPIYWKYGNYEISHSLLSTCINFIETLTYIQY